MIWLFRAAGRAALWAEPSILASPLGNSVVANPPVAMLATWTIGPLNVARFRRANTRLEEGEYNMGAGAASLNDDELGIPSEPLTSRNPWFGLRTNRIFVGKRADVLGVVGSTLTEV
jgi:hypothetical protein